ncbi:hypothetical protein D1007_35613 [Hordeum vulgare]|nr:hypothetical protein D1007_35613 [Hordeum vulgare]
MFAASLRARSASCPALREVAAHTSSPHASFVDAISVQTQPLLPTPLARRRRKEVSANFTPRLSFRIANCQSRPWIDSEMKAKRVLLWCLGILKDDVTLVSNEMLERYAQLFDRPLVDDVLEAFADFLTMGLRMRRSPLALLALPNGTLAAKVPP